MRDTLGTTWFCIHFPDDGSVGLRALVGGEGSQGSGTLMQGSPQRETDGQADRPFKPQRT